MFISIIQYDLHKNNENKGAHIYWIVCGLLILITGFRDGLGGDTRNYVELWLNIPDIFNINQDYIDSHSYQSGFLYFFSLAKTISNEYIILQIIHGIIINLIIFLFFRKYSTASFICIILYFILNYFEYNMEIVRESIAVCIGLIAYHFYITKRLIIAIVLCLIAFQFHVSAIILILMPFCIKIRYSKKTILLFATVMIAVYIIFPHIPDLTILIDIISKDSERLKEYDNREINQTLNVSFFIIHSIKCLALPIFAIYILKHRADKIIGLSMIYIVFYSMSTFSYGFYRFGNYFAPFYIILIATAIRIFLLKYIKIIYRPVICACFIALFLYMYQSVQLQVDNINGGRLYNRYIPYRSVLL